MKINYQLETDKEIEKITKAGNVPKLLLHSCCAPCSSYVLEYLSQYFKVTVLYYNPNIYPPEEYNKRLDEQKRLVAEMPMKNKAEVVSVGYSHEEFLICASGLESEPEGGARCEKCFRLRLCEAARAAKAYDCDYFTTTLTVSPHKNSALINQIADEVSREYHIAYLFSDFKKREGYKRSIVLSNEYSLYRQNYCGCEFSK